METERQPAGAVPVIAKWVYWGILGYANLGMLLVWVDPEHEQSFSVQHNVIPLL